MKLTSRKVYSLILFALLVSTILFSLPFLNFVPEIPLVKALAYEDFTTFTEVDGDGDITVDSATKVSWDTMRIDAVDYLYYNYGVDYFAGDFFHYIDITVTDVESGGATNSEQTTFWMLSETAGSYIPARETSIVAYIREQGASDDYWYFALYERNHHNPVITARFDPVDLGTTFYLTLNRTGDIVTLSVYTDSERTSLRTSCGGDSGWSEDAYDYCSTAVSVNSGGDPANHNTAFVENLSFGEEDPSPTLESHSADDPQINLSYNWFNITVSDPQGYTNLNYVDVQINTTNDAETVTLRWTENTNTFSEQSDSSNICSLNSTDSVRTIVDGNTLNLSFNYMFNWGSFGYCDVIADAVDDDTNSAQDLYSDDFFYGILSVASIVDTTAEDDNWGNILPSALMIQTQSFYAHDLYWVFYCNNSDMLWKTSSNGTDWSSLQVVKADVNSTSESFSLFYDSESDIVHYVRRVWGYGFTTHAEFGGDLYYRAGTPDSNGDISWLAVEQVAVQLNLTQNQVAYSMDIICDSDGYPWISYNFRYLDGQSQGIFVVTKSSTKDGTWDTAPGFLYNVSDTGIHGFTVGFLTPLPDTQVMAVFVNASYVDAFQTHLNSRLWDGDSWGSIQYSVSNNEVEASSDDGVLLADASNNYPYPYSTFGLVYVNGTSYYFMFYNGSGWEEEVDPIVTVGSSTTGNLVSHGGLFYLFYSNYSDQTISVLGRNLDGSWNSSMTIVYENRYGLASVDLTIGVTAGLQAYFDSNGDVISFIYSRNASSSWDLMHYSFSAQSLPTINSVIISNMEGCGNWIFADERFYQFRGIFSHGLGVTVIDTVGINFSDGTNIIYLYYDNTLRDELNFESFSLTIDPQFDEDKDPARINFESSEATINGDTLTVTWYLWITSNMFDAQDIDLYAFMNDTGGYEVDWMLIGSDYFNIYVLGGFTNSSSVGDAGQYQGRSPFDVYASDNSSVLVETLYRKLEHVHLEYKIWIPDAYIDYDQNFSLDLGMDFCFYGDDTWYQGWKTQIQTFGGSEIATGNNMWINYTVEHYRFNPTGGGSYEPMKQGKMYAYWEGYETGRDYFQLYTDLWFSSSNRSRMWGARVNSVHFGMKNDALFSLPWLFGDNWRALIQNFTDISYKDNILDYEGSNWGNHRYTSEIVMCRFWLNLSRPYSGINYYVRVQDYSSQDFNRLQIGQFEGIDDPVLIETTVPYMGDPGGLLGNFFGWLMESASFIVEGLTIGIMAGIDMFVSFLDILFGLAGWEGGASTIYSWITSFITWLITAFTYLIDLMVSLFSVMASWLVLGIQRFITIGTGLTNIYDNLVWIYTQANAGWVDASEFINPLLPLLPLAFFIWLLNSRDVEHIFHKISLCWNFIRTLLGFFIQMGQYTIQLVSAIIEAIQW